MYARAIAPPFVPTPRPSIASDESTRTSSSSCAESIVFDSGASADLFDSVLADDETCASSPFVGCRKGSAAPPQDASSTVVNNNFNMPSVCNTLTPFAKRRNPEEAYILEFVDKSGTASRLAYWVKPHQISLIKANQS
jgi:hypothetical protein